MLPKIQYGNQRWKEWAPFATSSVRFTAEKGFLMKCGTYNVLFLCTGNSARSILAEALLNHHARHRFHAFSAGSHPKGEVHPLALRVLRERGVATEGLRSKAWAEFARADAPTMDFVFTVCDNAAGEVCPVWPGHPMVRHWGIPDPASASGSEEDRLNAFRLAAEELESRILTFAGSGPVRVNP